MRSFDAVVCEQAIQFFADPEAAVREMRRVLSPGGRATVSVCRSIRFAPTYVALAGVLERQVGRDAAGDHAVALSRLGDRTIPGPVRPGRVR